MDDRSGDGARGARSSLGVIGVHARAVTDEPARQLDRRREPDVVRAGLERKPEEPDRAAGDTADRRIDPLGEETLFATFAFVAAAVTCIGNPRSSPDVAIVWSSFGRQLPPKPKLGCM